MVTLHAPYDRLKSRLLGFLLPQAADGFAEAIEIQTAVPGFPLLIGAVFPLSLLAGALGHAADGKAEVQAVAAHLVDQLVRFGDAEGWRYFNLCPEIPPDADDLAQVITLLVERRYPDRARLLEGPVCRLMDNATAPGRFRTWLVGSPEAAAAADEQWAAGRDPVHPEVVANVLHALLLLDAERWREDILAGADWLMERQVQGLWTSYWYYGHGYGTHLVLRLLAEVARRWPEAAPRSGAARRAARAALLERQHPDGSWECATPPQGLRELGGSWEPAAGRTLETALCLSAVGRLEGDDELSAARDRAIAFLAATQEEDGGFAAEPYYFTVGRVPHQSRCLTGAAVLEALSSDGQAAR